MRRGVVAATLRDVGLVHTRRSSRSIRFFHRTSKRSIVRSSDRDDPDRPSSIYVLSIRIRSVNQIPTSRLVAKINDRLLATIRPTYKLSTLNQLLLLLESLTPVTIIVAISVNFYVRYVA